MFLLKSSLTANPYFSSDSKISFKIFPLKVLPQAPKGKFLSYWTFFSFCTQLIWFLFPEFIWKSFCFSGCAMVQEMFGVSFNVETILLFLSLDWSFHTDSKSFFQVYKIKLDLKDLCLEVEILMHNSNILYIILKPCATEPQLQHTTQRKKLFYVRRGHKTQNNF